MRVEYDQMRFSRGPAMNNRVSESSWRARGACSGLDTSVFFPVSDNDDDAEEAKSICAICTVRQQCLDYALDKREHEGVWGGATERERRRILRQRRKTAAA